MKNNSVESISRKDTSRDENGIADRVVADSRKLVGRTSVHCSEAGLRPGIAQSTTVLSAQMSVPVCGDRANSYRQTFGETIFKRMKKNH